MVPYVQGWGNKCNESYGSKELVVLLCEYGRTASLRKESSVLLAVIRGSM